MKSKKIDTYYKEDMEKASEVLFFLCQLGLKEAEDTLGDVNYELKNHFCSECDSHIDQDCSCAAAEWDGYDDE